MNDLYLEIIEPSTFITNFENENDFKEWLELGTIQDLKCTLKAFEVAELYELCIIIKKSLVKMQGTKYGISNTDIN